MLAGAYGAHGFGPEKSPYFRGIFENANRYHLLHSAVLALAPALCRRPHLARDSRAAPRRASHAARWREQVGGLFTAGTALFCSSQYALGVTKDRRAKMRKIGPPGATMLVAGWLALALP